MSIADIRSKILGKAGKSESVLESVRRVEQLKRDTPNGVLLGSAALAAQLDALDVVDEYRFLIQPRLVGRGPTLYARGLPSTRTLELLSTQPMKNGAIAVHYRRAR